MIFLLFVNIIKIISNSISQTAIKQIQELIYWIISIYKFETLKFTKTMEHGNNS